MAGIGNTFLWAFNPVAALAKKGIEKLTPAPKLPAYPLLPDTSAEDAATLERKRKYGEQRAKAYSAGGRRGTLLTGALGLSTPAPTQRKTLLGE